MPRRPGTFRSVFSHESRLTNHTTQCFLLLFSGIVVLSLLTSTRLAFSSLTVIYVAYARTNWIWRFMRAVFQIIGFHPVRVRAHPSPDL